LPDTGKDKMITFEEAHRITCGNVRLTGSENVRLDKALHRILAEDIRSDTDLPPFNKSAVDGFACKKEDLGKELLVIESIPAGKQPLKKIHTGQCARIMTGAMVPEGAECVVMVEDTETIPGEKIRHLKESSAINICFKGEDVKSGTVVLEKGTILEPQHMAVLASVGVPAPNVSVQPRIGIISTGDELVEPGVDPAPGQIRNSNSVQLVAQVLKTSVVPEYLGIAKDNEASLRDLLKSAIAGRDIVLLTGGVSMGDFDYVPEVLESLGAKILFKSIAIQPGRPTLFGISGNTFIFGLPGNPVSSFVLFEMLVKPFILSMMGAVFKQPFHTLPMGVELKRKKSERMSLIPVRIEEGQVFPVDYHGSAHIHAYVFANGIITLEPGKTQLEKGELTDVRPL
jgi:molybdopterin molybdotransferase